MIAANVTVLWTVLNTTDGGGRFFFEGANRNSEKLHVI